MNEVVLHGIPGPRKLKEGDIVSVDVGAYSDGFHGDCAATYACGEISDEAKKLIQVTQQSFWEGIKTVSYTHLDEQKYQERPLLRPRAAEAGR